MCASEHMGVCSCYTTPATVHIRKKNISGVICLNLLSKHTYLNGKYSYELDISVCVCVCISSMRTLGCLKTLSNLWALPWPRVMCSISHTSFSRCGMEWVLWSQPTWSSTGILDGAGKVISRILIFSLKQDFK